MDTLALILVIIGALNWGLVGLFQFDLVASLFGGMSGTFARIIYTLVGLAGIWAYRCCSVVTAYATTMTVQTDTYAK